MMNLNIPKKVALVPFLFFLIIVILPVVDNLTGALFKLNIMPEGAIGSPSQLARFGLFLLVIWLIDNAKYSSPLRVILLVSCYLLTIEVALACIHMNLIAFLYGIVFSIKILFSLCCYYYVAYWLNFDKKRTIYVINKMITYGTIVSLLVLAAYFSGFHISNYQLGIATRGLFISGNGLAIVLGISTIFLVHFNKKITIFIFMHILLLLITTALLGTKASLVFLLVALTLLSIKLAKQAPLITTVIAFFVGIYLLLPLIELLSDLFENIIFKFNNIDDKLHFIASSRDRFIQDAFNEMDVTSFNALRILFGGGAYYAYTDYSTSAVIVRKALENDLFELFFSYGIFIMITYLAIFTYALKQCLNKGNIVIAIALSLIFLHSITMGHVLFNGTSAITYALCLALAVKGARVKSDDF
ncbi:MAG: hypothetical protein ACJAXJ_003009 [Colwellia sp.]